LNLSEELAMQFPWFSNQKNGLVRVGRPFVKMHGLRNDFVIVDGRVEPFTPSLAEITHICERHEGIGADELLVVESSRSNKAYASLRIFNPDGREVEACGNATRCIGWLMLKESDRKKVVIETRGGMLACQIIAEKLVSVEMGKIKTEWHEIPLSREIDTLHLKIGEGPLQDPVGMNIGNPHAVFFVEDLAAVNLSLHGLKLQKNGLFPEEANIGVAQLLDAGTLQLSVWERPGVLTTACGTGACVAVAAAHRRGLTTEKCMTVIMSAGSVTIELQENGMVIMTGPVETCYAGYLPVTR
jgi:diaminopimelate epimerase